MTAITILIGMMLILVGIGGYGWSTIEAARTPDGHASWTALIPSIIGLILVVCGGIGTSEKYRKHAMHAAVLVALLGLLAVAGRLIPALIAGKPMGVAMVSQIFTAALCAILVAFGVHSFIQARKKRLV